MILFQYIKILEELMTWKGYIDYVWIKKILKTIINWC